MRSEWTLLQDKIARLTGAISELRAQLQQAQQSTALQSADLAKKLTIIERLQSENDQLKQSYATKWVSFTNYLTFQLIFYSCQGPYEHRRASGGHACHVKRYHRVTEWATHSSVTRACAEGQHHAAAWLWNQGIVALVHVMVNSWPSILNLTQLISVAQTASWCCGSAAHTDVSWA